MMQITMRLQHKAWALVLVVVGLCAAAAMAGARFIVNDSFRQLEHERAEREGERALRVLDQQFQGLSATVRDYAYWVDAARFVRGQSPDFFQENFDSGNMGYLRISEVAVFDLRGRTLASAALEAGAMAPVGSARLQSLRELVAPILASPDAKTLVRTYRVRDGQLEFVTAAAVHDPAQAARGPQGAIAMVRRLDAAELARFSEVLMAPLRISLETPAHAGGHIHIEPMDPDRDELHAVLRDHHGQAVAELVLVLDHRLQQQGQSLSWAGMGLAALAGVLASLLLVWLLDRLLLRHLQRLYNEVRQVTEQGPTSAARVAVAGPDELRSLGAGINRLLDRVRQDAEAQRVAHERQEALQMQLLQSQKTEALGRLTGGIAHDFNNSLAAITGWVHLAAEDLESEHPSRTAIQQAQKAIRYADGLMRQLLAFGRQTAPKLRRLHWSSLIEETRQMVGAGLTRECEVVVDYRVDDDEVDADPTQLQQVLVNLLINAADAMNGRGRIELTLTAVDLPQAAHAPLLPGTAELAAGHYLCLTVEDQGPGISPEHLERVFDPFFTTKGKGRGTGLGLSVAQGIMVRHQGGIGVASTPGAGARFHVYLPVSRHDGAIAPITSPGGGVGQGRSVLFADDDQLVRHAWSALLDRQGWQVTRARDGEEAWAQFARSGQHFDVVLTDQSMPRLDGVGLARRIRATASPPPIVLISGHVNEVGADDLKALFSAVLHKPVDAADLDRVLQQVVASGDTGH